MAIDYERFNEERNAGLATIANGPFPAGSIGYLEDTGYPTFDPDGAQAEFETVPRPTPAPTSSTLSFNTTNDPFNVESNSLILSMWQEAFGDPIDATIEPIEQGQYIGLALAGDFQVFPWRSHSGSDPDQQRRWWSSATAQPIGTVGTNFGRFVDEVIDENLDIIRTNPDPDARREAAETINRRFGEQVYDLWLNWALWGVITAAAGQRRREQRAARAAARARACTSVAATRSPRSGATTATAADRRQTSPAAGRGRPSASCIRVFVRGPPVPKHSDAHEHSDVRQTRGPWTPKPPSTSSSRVSSAATTPGAGELVADDLEYDNVPIGKNLGREALDHVPRVDDEAASTRSSSRPTARRAPATS